MGNCNCIKDSDKLEMKLEIGRVREIELYLKDNPRLIYFLKRIQSRYRGLISRKKFKSALPMHLNQSLFEKDSYTNFKEVTCTKIVIFSF